MRVRFVGALLAAGALLSSCVKPPPPEAVGVGCRADNGVAYTSRPLWSESDLLSISTKPTATVLVAYTHGAIATLPLPDIGLSLVPPKLNAALPGFDQEVAKVLRGASCRFMKAGLLSGSFGFAPEASLDEIIESLALGGVQNLTFDLPTHEEAKNHDACVDPYPATGYVYSSAERVGADVAWGHVGKGEGAGVAVLDSGVWAGHTFLGSAAWDRMCVHGGCNCTGAACGWTGTADPTRGGACGSKECGHGSSVAGTAAGQCGASLGTKTCSDTEVCVAKTPTDPGPSIAPEASILDLRAGQTKGSVTRNSMVVALAMLIAAIDLDPDIKSRVSAVNISLTLDQLAAATTSAAAVGPTYGTTQECFDAFPCLGRLIEMLRGRGVAVVVAGGNYIKETELRAPGCLPGAISVGPVDGYGDVIGNSGPLLDFVAPGDVVWGVTDEGSPTQCCSTNNAGSSVAAPAVAGAVALARAGGETDLGTIVDGLCTNGFPPTAAGTYDFSWTHATCPSSAAVPTGGYSGARQLDLTCYPLKVP